MRELSLFTGAGGGVLASHLLGWETKGYVEIDDYCQKIIAQRIKDGVIPEAPIFGNIRTFIRQGFARSYQGMVDVVTGGFPCQPFSVAGKRKGKDDSRNLWPETLRVVQITRPPFVFLENVRGLVNSGYFSTILSDLAKSGYDARWCVLSAAELGAPHKRDRLWIVAHSEHDGQLTSKVAGRIAQGSNGDTSRSETALELEGCSKQHAPMAYSKCEQVDTQRGDSQSGRYTLGRHPEATQYNDRQANTNSPDECCGLAHSSSERLERAAGEIIQGNSSRPSRSSWWASEPDVGRMAYGVASRVDRLKAIGNGQVPLVAATAWEILTEGLL